MKNFKNLFPAIFNRQHKPYYTPIVLGVIALILFGVFILLQNRQVKPADQQSYQDIYPGTTTIQEAIKKLGQPITTTQEGDQTIYKFESGNQYYPHVLKAADDQVQLIIQELTDKPNDNQIQKYTQSLNEQPVVLYNEESLLGFHLYVFLRSGLAVKASENKGIGLYLLYFQPTDIQTFISRYAPDYSLVLDEKQLYRETHSDLSPPTSPTSGPASPSAQP